MSLIDPLSPSLSVKKISTLSPLSPDFYHQPTVTVAKKLLGKLLVRKQGKHWLSAQVVETEAYLGKEDPASHAYPGPTKRSWPMYENGGTCYVYLCYGVNYCMNAVTQKRDSGGAVLLRAATPVTGLKEMARLRNRALSPCPTQKEVQALLSGPGKLAQGLGIDLNDNGKDFFAESLKIVDIGTSLSKNQIGISPRIGISKAQDSLLRFFVRQSPWLSRKEK